MYVNKLNSFTKKSTYGNHERFSVFFSSFSLIYICLHKRSTSLTHNFISDTSVLKILPNKGPYLIMAVSRRLSKVSWCQFLTCLMSFIIAEFVVRLPYEAEKGPVR